MGNENEVINGEMPINNNEPPSLGEILTNKSAETESISEEISTAGDLVGKEETAITDEPAETEDAEQNAYEEAAKEQQKEFVQPEPSSDDMANVLHISHGVYNEKKSVLSKNLQIAAHVISSLTLCITVIGLVILYSRINTAEAELERQGEYIKSIEAEKNALEADYVEAMSIIDAPSEPEISVGIEAEDGKLLVYDSSVGYAWIPILSDVEQHSYRKSGFSVDDRNRMCYTDENGQESSYFGIDVSSYQGDIKWQLVREDGVEFAFIRIGYRGYGDEGRLCVDEKFETNYDGAHSVGIDTGVYFFSQATTPEEAVEEAEFLLEILDGRPLEYPIVFDWETVFVAEGENPPRTEDMMPQTLTLSAIAFCETIEDAGYKSMVYTNKKQAVMKYDLRQLKSYPIWFAYYDTELNYCYQFDVWQYGTAFVDGIDGEVDVNIAMIN